MPRRSETPVPVRKIGSAGSETLGRLLQAYGRGVGLKARGRIQVLRRERLRAELGRVGLRLSPDVVSVLADGLAYGRLALTDTHLYLMNDGGDGVGYTCGCAHLSFGECSVVHLTGGIQCRPGPLSACAECTWTLAVTVPQVSAIAKSGSLAEQFVEHLPAGFAQAVDDLAELEYPVVDRVSLQEQLHERSLDSIGARSSCWTFPIMSLADALDKLCASGSPPSGPASELLRWAVGDYQRKLTNSLAHALSTGAVQANGETRELRVKINSGVTVDVFCDCEFFHGPPLPPGSYCGTKVLDAPQVIVCDPAGCPQALLDEDGDLVRVVIRSWRRVCSEVAATLEGLVRLPERGLVELPDCCSFVFAVVTANLRSWERADQPDVQGGPVRRDALLQAAEAVAPRAGPIVRLGLQAVLLVEAGPWARSLWEEIGHRVGATELERHQMVDLVLARPVGRDTVRGEHFAFGSLKGAKTLVGLDRGLCASSERIARWLCRSSTSRSCRCEAADPVRADR
jgi:hypothetical protein